MHALGKFEQDELVVRVAVRVILGQDGVSLLLASLRAEPARGLRPSNVVSRESVRIPAAFTVIRCWTHTNASVATWMTEARHWRIDGRRQDL